MRTTILGGRKVAYQGEACEVIMPGLDGEFSVLDFHQSFLYRLRRGTIKVKEKVKQKEEKLFRIEDGLAKFSGNTLLILCEMK
ncbi:MAG: hypothetical protein ISS92_05285 [Candidatus Omnitrophica bacterium]|nr:hypothetical protein [Candidatus Omnitrophota bacterium]